MSIQATNYKLQTTNYKPYIMQKLHIYICVYAIKKNALSFSFTQIYSKLYLKTSNKKCVDVKHIIPNEILTKSGENQADDNY